jgi:hypothetical protein
MISDMILEEHGVLGEATITELALHFVPLEPDLLSLELEDAFNGLCLMKDPSSIFASAKALMLLQKQYGLFPRILGKGDNAQRLAELLQRMRNEEDVNASADPNTAYLASFGLTPSSLVENLIIVDREVDFPTLLSTQLTYEGLLDEVFGITNNNTEVDSSVLGGAPPTQSQQQNGSTPTAATKRKILLDSSDKLYPSLRDANFATVGPALNRTARRLASDSEAMHSKDQTVSDLKAIVQSKLPTYQAESASLKIHTSLAEEVLKHTRSDTFRSLLDIQQNLLAGTDPSSMHDALDDLIARAAPLSTVLRLLCLMSSLSNGLRQRDIDHFKRQITQGYGYQHLLTLSRLEKMSLLITRDSHRGYLNPIGAALGSTATDWNSLRKSLSLWSDDVQEDNPTDPSYVFSGYAPLSVRLVQAILQKSALLNPSSTSKTSTANPSAPAATASSSGGWKSFEDPLSRIRGATVDIVQSGHSSEISHAKKTLRAGGKEGPKVSIVFFLGGVTYAEVAALRLVSKQLEEASGRKIVIATTGMVSGGKAVGTAVENKGLAP